MTVTAKQAKAMLADDRLCWIEHDLAATVVELWERLATVEAERDELQDQVLTVQTSSAEKR